MDIEKLVGMHIDDAEELLKKKKIKYEIIKKVNLFKKKNYVYDVKEVENTSGGGSILEIYVSKFFLLPLIFLISLLIIITSVVMGITSLYYKNRPTIKGNPTNWAKSSLVSVTKDAKIKNLSYYEYCISEKKTSRNCNWKRTDTKNTTVSKSGIYYVYFRGVGADKSLSPISNRVQVKIDNDNPVLNKVNEVYDEENKKVTVKLEAIDSLSGIKEYYYSLNGKDFQKGTDEFTFNVDKNKKYELTIKIVDQAGNVLEATYLVKLNNDDNTNTTDIDPDNNTGNTENNNGSNPDDNNGIGDVEEPDENTTNPDDKKPTPEETTTIMPTIDLNGVPSEFIVTEDYPLPSNYSFGSGTSGNVTCLLDHEKAITSTKDIWLGNHNITCTVINDLGDSATTSKDINVVLEENPDEIKDGWIIYNIYYPEYSTNWEWMLKRPGEERGTGWVPYTGPILIRVEDVENIYIRYDMNGKKQVVGKLGEPIVVIEPDSYSVRTDDVTKVNITYDDNAIKKEYHVDGGEWLPYKGSFWVAAGSTIEAKVTIDDSVKNNKGEVVINRTKSAIDKVHINEIYTKDRDLYGSLNIKIIPEKNPLALNETTNVTITADNDVRNLMYSINGGAWKPYTGSFNVSKNTTIYAMGTATRSMTLANDTVKYKDVTESTSAYIGDATDYTNYYVALSGNTLLDNTLTTPVTVYYYGTPIESSYRVNAGNWESLDLSTKNLGEYGVNTTIDVRTTFQREDGSISTSYDSITISENTNSLRVNIIPSTTSVLSTEEANISLSTNYPAKTLEYKINDGNWTTYNGDFKVMKNTLVTAKATKLNTDNTVQTVYNTLYVREVPLKVSILGDTNVLLNTKATLTIESNNIEGKLFYSLDGINYTEYTEALKLNIGDKLYAKVEVVGLDGNKTTAYTMTEVTRKYVTNYGPIISVNPESLTNSGVIVSLTPRENMGEMYYNIDNGEWKKYENPFSVTTNAVVRAYGLTLDEGIQSLVSSYRITNIRTANMPYVKITANPDPIDISNTNEVKVNISCTDCEKLEYSTDGTHYLTYSGELTFNYATTIYAKGTNFNGSVIETLVLNNLPVKPEPIDSLKITMYARPSVGTNLDSTTVTIEYDSRSDIKEYKIGKNGIWMPYTEPFKVLKNTTIYAHAKNEVLENFSELKIDYLRSGINDPEISTNPNSTNLTKEVTVTIKYDASSILNEYKIGNDGNWTTYSKPFKVDTNTTIYARNKNGEGDIGLSELTITNILPKPQVVTVDEGEFYLIKFNYPSTSDPNQREYKWKKDGEWKVYPTDGIILVKQEYADKYSSYKPGDTIKITDKDGNTKDFNGDLYILDVPTSELSEHIFIRWETRKPEAPEILTSSEDYQTELNVAILYEDMLTSRLYKIEYDDGTIVDWRNYDDAFKITKNCTIYAKGASDSEVWSDEAKLKVDNIDVENPEITDVKYESTTKAITVNVEANDSQSGIDYYMYSVDGRNYVKRLENTYTFNNLDSNTSYGVYVKVVDKVGNISAVYTATVDTLDISDAKVSEDPNKTIYAKEKTITIGHADPSISIRYSLDGTTFNDYSDPFRVDENTDIKIELSDGLNTKMQTYPVTTIDNNEPIINKVTVLGRSSKFLINVDAKDNESSVKNYLVSTDGTNYKTYTTNDLVVKDLVNDTEYTIYIKVEDEAGNVSAVYTTTKKTTIIGDIDYSISPNNTDWAYEKELTIDYPGDETDGYSYLYSTDDGVTWNPYTKPIPIEENNVTVIAKVVDGPNTKLASSITITKIDRTIPTISLADLPSRFETTDNYKLPSSYTVDNSKSGGSAECKIGNITYSRLLDLPTGEHEIVCTVTTGAGKTATAKKTVTVVRIEVIEAESLLSAVAMDEVNETGYYNIKVNETIYTTHVYVLDGDQTITTNTTYGDLNDCASGTAESQMAKNMVIVKVNGDYTINSNVTVGPKYHSEYGGPKGFMLYVTGKLTNNGTIDNSHGAYAKGDNVLLWKNALTDDYEYIPAVGAAGGTAKTTKGNGNPGKAGSTVSKRALGGGAAGYHSGYSSRVAGSGTAATSYSGGTGGGSSDDGNGHDGYPYGGAGGEKLTGSISSGGAGNPGGKGYKNGSNGTGGLLIIYAHNYKNNGLLTVSGATGGGSAGSSGGGSLNIFTDEPIIINQLGTELNTKFNQIVGNYNILGGQTASPGGTGTLNIGEIHNNQYYDLKDIITDKVQEFTNSVTITSDSILAAVDTLNESGYYYVKTETNNYSLHLEVLNGDQIITTNTTYGDLNDCASGTQEYQMAKNMVIVKVNGNYTINSGVTVGPKYHSEYGGPKGFMLYVTGKLSNNGTIDNSHGAYAKGENVLLWKNSKTNNYEYIPAVGGAGGNGCTTSCKGNDGKAGSTIAATRRATGGGGGGAVRANSSSSGGGASGTSYSGGSGGGGTDQGTNNSPGLDYGGAGGYGLNAWGGSGNPGGDSSNGSSKGKNGTGGLLVIYANGFSNNGNITALGTQPTTTTSGYGGGSSGGGSINIFTNQSTNISKNGIDIPDVYNLMIGNTNVLGGDRSGYTNAYGGAGGTGTVNIGEIRDGQYYDLKEIIRQDILYDYTYEGDSLLSIIDNLNTPGYYNFKVNNVVYPVRLEVLNGDQVITTNTQYGSLIDCASGKEESQMARHMVIVKVNGDYTVNSGVTVGPKYHSEYGGPKGFILYVTGTLTNNGTIDNSHGAYAKGDNVYLWKNSITNNYEYIPAVGGAGGEKRTNSGAGLPGKNGSTITESPRATGGGGSGGYSGYSSRTVGAGTAGTSYSGGTGGGASSDGNGHDGYPYGGAGGEMLTGSISCAGAGNPGGKGYKNGSNGTGGLLVIYSNNFLNKGNITAIGADGGNCGSTSGNAGSSGGGSINIFIDNYLYNLDTELSTNVLYNNIKGNSNVNGGQVTGIGGIGTINIGGIRNGQYYDLKTIIEQDKEALLNPVTFALNRIPKVEATNPTFSVDSTEYTTSKTITINYTGDFEYEYSLDEQTWHKYTGPITINENTTVLARMTLNDYVVAASSITITKIDNVIPTIEIDLEDNIIVGSSNPLPTSSNINSLISGGSISCSTNNTIVTNTSELEIGTYEVTCTITSNVGRSSSATKIINIIEEINNNEEILE